MEKILLTFVLILIPLSFISLVAFFPLLKKKRKIDLGFDCKIKCRLWETTPAGDFYWRNNFANCGDCIRFFGTADILQKEIYAGKHLLFLEEKRKWKNFK